MTALSAEAIARKIVAACDPARIHDGDHFGQVLVAVGVRPADVDMDQWVEIKAKVDALLPARLAAEAVQSRDRAQVSCVAVGGVVALSALLAAGPALAAEQAPLSPWSGVIALAILVGAIAITWLIWPRGPFADAQDPHDEPFGDAPSLDGEFWRRRK